MRNIFYHAQKNNERRIYTCPMVYSCRSEGAFGQARVRIELLKKWM